MGQNCVKMTKIHEIFNKFAENLHYGPISQKFREYFLSKINRKCTVFTGSKHLVCSRKAMKLNQNPSNISAA